jgi:hypothetical protein
MTVDGMGRRLPISRSAKPRWWSGRLPIWRRATPRRWSRRLPDLKKADTAPAGPQHGGHSKDALQSLRYLAKVDSNILNSQNSRSLDLSRFRLLRRKGALDTWRWPPRPWRRCLSAPCCSPRVEIAA